MLEWRIELAAPPADGPTEISKIAFDEQGRMLLAERPAPTGAFDFEALAEPAIGRVLRYAIVGTAAGRRVWQDEPDEYALGFPSDYRNGDGGADVGDNYDRNGEVIAGSCGGFVWMSGEDLRDLPDQALQGVGAWQNRPRNAPPVQGYFVIYADGPPDEAARGHMGDVAILRSCEAASHAGLAPPASRRRRRQPDTRRRPAVRRLRPLRPWRRLRAGLAALRLPRSSRRMSRLRRRLARARARLTKCAESRREPARRPARGATSRSADAAVRSRRQRPKPNARTRLARRDRRRSGRATSAAIRATSDIYVVMSSGAYVYDAVNNSLKPVASEDLRALTGVQPYVKDAPVSLIYVADAKKMTMPADLPKPMKDAVEELKQSMKWADSAVVAENVYIFAASEGLATGVRALIDRAALAKALKLGSDQSIMLAQCVGLPKR